MTWNYEITNNNEVVIKFGDAEGGLVQPAWPDSTAWANKAEATAWAEAKIAEYEDPTAPAAGNSPDEPTLARGEYVEPISYAPVIEDPAMEEATATPEEPVAGE